MGKLFPTKEERRLKKLRKTALELSDHHHRRDKWGFANEPSDWDASDRKLKKLEQKVRDLGGDPDACDRWGVTWSMLAPEFDDDDE